MSRPKAKPRAALIDQLLGEASWLLSDVQALTDYGRREEAATEWARAALCEEQVACLLEADGQEREAAVHRVSAASCCEQLGHYARAVTLLRTALSAELLADYRAQIDQQRKRCLAQAQKELRQASKNGSRKQSSVVS